MKLKVITTMEKERIMFILDLEERDDDLLARVVCGRLRDLGYSKEQLIGLRLDVTQIGGRFAD